METVDIEASLETATALADGGRALDAIDELAAVYAACPDHRVARALVDVRHRAFAELVPAPGQPEWPPSLPDPFPGGEPQATPAELTGAVLGGAITNHGYLRVDGLVDATTADRLRERVDQAYDARERVASGDALETAAPYFVPYGPGRRKAQVFGPDLFLRVVDSPDALCDLVDVFTTTGVRSAVQEYLGERPAMIANKWIMRRLSTGVELGDFHQDGAFLGQGIRTVDCWIALSHCGPGTGRPGIDFVPRRLDRVLPTGEGAAFKWSLSEQTVRSTLPDAELLSPVFAPGDAFFFDERLVHRTSVGTELSSRYALESWFVAPSSYPDRHVPVVL